MKRERILPIVGATAKQLRGHGWSGIPARIGETGFWSGFARASGTLKFRDRCQPGNGCFGTIMEILILSLLFVLNGLLSMSEIAVVSARKVRLQQLANEGNRGAARALALAEDPSRFLSTIQVGITFVGIFSGAFGYAALASGLAGALSGFPLLAAYSEPMALAIVVVAVAYFSLIVGELVPKRLALQNPERVACHAAEPMRALSMLARPVVSFLSGSTNLVLRLVGAADSRQSPVSEEPDLWNH